MTNVTAACDYFMRGSIATECSGHGTCVAERPNDFSSYEDDIGKCVCDDGWRGDGDMMNAAGLDCHINENFMNTWWLANGFAFFFLILFSGYCLSVAYSVQGKKFMEKGGNQAICLSMAFAFARALDAFLRAAFKEHSGDNLFIAIVHAIGGVIFWGYLACFYCEQFLNIVVKQAKLGGAAGEAMKKKCENMHRVMKFMPPMAIPAYILIVVSNLDKDPSHHKIYSIFYFLVHFILSYFLVNIVALPVATAFYEILQAMPEESQDAKTKALVAKMKIFVREIGNAGHFNTISTFAFMVFPFLWNCQTFQLAFAWPSVVPLMCVAAFIVKPAAKGKNKVSPGRNVTTGHTTTTTASDTSDGESK